MSKRVVKVKRSASIAKRLLPEQGLLAAGLMVVPLAQSIARDDSAPLIPDGVSSSLDGSRLVADAPIDVALSGSPDVLALTEPQPLHEPVAVPFDERLLDALVAGGPDGAGATKTIDPDLHAALQAPVEVLAEGGAGAGSAVGGLETWVVGQAQGAAASGGAGAASGTAAAGASGSAAVGAAAGVAALTPAAMIGLAVGAGVLLAASGGGDSDAGDRTPPAAPTVSLETDTGSSATDRITKDGALKVEGIESGATVEYSTDGGVTWNESFTAAPGVNNVLVRQTDAAGNVSQPSTALSFTLDTEVTNVTAKLAASSDTGAQGDNQTTDRSPTIEGTAEPGAAVKVTIGTREFEATADGQGLWSVSVPEEEPLAPGQYSPQIQVTDTAGNVSTISSDLGIELTKNLFIVDGPLQSAKVYYDKNLNGVADPDEFLGETDENGALNVKYAPVAGAKIIVVPDENTTDAYSGNKFDLSLAANDTGDAADQVISPLSTLVASGAVDQAALKTALGIDQGVDLATFNFVDALKTGGGGDAATLAAAQKIAAATVAIGNLVESSIKAKQAVSSQSLTQKEVEQATQQIFETAAKVVAALPPGTPLDKATTVASKISMAATLDSTVSVDDLVANTVKQATSAEDLDNAISQVETAIQNSDTTKVFAGLITTSAQSLSTVSGKLETLFSQVSNADGLQAVVGSGGSLDELEDEATDEVRGDINQFLQVTLGRDGIFDRDGDKVFEQGPQADFVEDDEYLVEGADTVVKGNVFANDALGSHAKEVFTVSLGLVQSTVPDYVKGSPADPNQVGSSYSISTSDYGGTTVPASTLLTEVGLDGTTPLTGSWSGGGYAFDATQGSAIAKTITVAAGQTLTFDYQFGSFDYLPWNDYGFVTLKKDGGVSSDDGLVELVDVRDLKGPGYYTDAGVYQDFESMNVPQGTSVQAFGSVQADGMVRFSYTFKEAGTYTLGIGATDVGDTIFDTILTVQNIRVDGQLVGGDAAQTFGHVEVDAAEPVVDVTALVQTGFYGTLIITKSGDYLYQPGGANADPIVAGALVEDTFTYSVKLANGQLATQKIVFTVMGEPTGGLAAASDTGVAGDAITSAATIAGVAAAGAQVTVSVGGTDFGPVTVPASGNWSVPLTGLVDGTYTPVIKITNKGAVSSAEGTAFTIDATAAAPSLSLGADTGSSATDAITSNGALTVSGAEPGAKVEYSADGGQTWGETFSPVEGANSVLVRQTDVAGNVGTSAQAFTFTLDTTAPGAPSARLTSDTGASATDGVTSLGQLTVTGKEKGATLEYSTDGGQTWGPSFKPVDGANSVLVRQVDVAGNASQPSTPVNFTLDPSAGGPLLSNGTQVQVQVVEGQGILYAPLATEANGTVVYSLGGDDAGLLEINPGTGVVTLKSGAVLDVDGTVPKVSYNFTVTAKDADQNASSQAVTVSVVNDPADDPVPDTTAPVFSVGSAATSTVVEGQSALFSALATDGSGSVVYSLEGDDADLLQIDSSGRVTLKSGELDAGSKGSYGFTVKATDGDDNEAIQTVSVTVAGEGASSSTAQVLDDLSPAGTQLAPRAFDASTASFALSDDPARTNYTEVSGFGEDDSLTLSGDVSLLSISNEGSDVSIIYNDGDVLSTIVVKGIVPDPDNTFVFDIATFNALGVGDIILAGADATAPTFSTTGPVTATVTENQAILHTALATDASGVVTYSLTGTDAAKLSIDSSGVVRLTDGVLDVDAQGAQASYSFNVVATDASSNASTQAVTVAVTNDAADDTVADTSKPLFANGSQVAVSVMENQGEVYAALATDAGSPVTYTLGGADAGLLEIDAAGRVTIKNGPLDVDAQDAKTSYNFTVTATDGQNNAASQSVTVDLVNDPSDDDVTSPTFTSPAAVLVNEGQSQLYVAQATDAESASVVYSLKAGEGDVDALDIDATTGAVTLKTGVGDHETKTSYTFTVLADDGATAPSEQQVTVELNDLDETDGAAQLVGPSLIGLLDEGVPLADGTDVLVAGTAFLGGSGAPNLAAAAGLFGDADVTVKLGQGPLDAGVLTRTDAQFDQLIDDLQAAGMDTLSIDSGDTIALAQAGFSFDAGTDVLVNGTAFLGGPGAPNLMAAANLFGGADVTAQLNPSDVATMVASGDAGFDAMIDTLHAAGVDTVSLTAAQASVMDDAGLTFDAGTDVMVTGTAFIGSGQTLAIHPSLAGAAALFADADVTVALSTTDGQQLLTQTDAQFDKLIDDLQAAGMDTLAIDAGQAAALALDDANFSFDAGTDVLVNGTGFLGAPAADLQHLFNAADAGGKTDVAVAMSDGDFERYLAGGAQSGDVAELLTALHEAGVDHLLLDPSQVLEAVAAGIDTGGTAAAALADQMLGLTTTKVSLADFHAADLQDLTEVIQGMDALMSIASNAPGAGLAVDDELANALAEAGVDTANAGGVDLLATPDIHDTGDGGLAILASTAEDMVQAGVGKVVFAPNSDVAFALRDFDQTGTDLGFTLGDLPAFDKTANPDGHIGLVVDQDDLAALVKSLGSNATEADAIVALAGKGFTDLVLAPETQVDSAAQGAATNAGIEISDASDVLDDLQISQPDLVRLLGQTDDPNATFDPFDPFHKP